MTTSNTASAVLAVGLVAGLFLLGREIHTGVVEFKERDRVVTVKGLAEREVDADVAIWTLRFVDASDDYDALFTSIDAKTTAITAFLGEAGFEHGDVTVAPANVIDKRAQRWGGGGDVGLRYSATRDVTVYTTDVDRVRETTIRLQELGRQGIVFEQASPQYLFTGLNDLKPSMIEDATREARAVAEKFAGDSGSRVGKIRSARQGQFSISQRDASTPHVKKVRVVSTVDYYLAD